MPWPVTGVVFEIALVFLLAEAVLLAVLRLRSRSGPSPLALAANLGAGAALLLAARAATLEADWLLISGALLAALALHILDLAWRWRAGRT